MIRIHKPASPPDVLAVQGRPESQSNCDAYAKNSGAYDHGTAKFSFDSGLYGHSSVKEALIEAQHDKCCFCESKISHISYGDVEHFRPKAGYRQSPDDPLGRPGYYWLAYEWTNLYLACQLCNQRFKKNTFPLQDPGHRCLNHLGDLVLEEPLFIDPVEVDPEDHIEFSAEQPMARNGSPQGAVTIQALGLQREPLRERRFDRYKILLSLKNVVAKLPSDDPDRQEALAILNNSVKDSAEYAAMARSLMSRP